MSHHHSDAFLLHCTAVKTHLDAYLVERQEIWDAVPKPISPVVIIQHSGPWEAAVGEMLPMALNLIRAFAGADRWGREDKYMALTSAVCPCTQSLDNNTAVNRPSCTGRNDPG